MLCGKHEVGWAHNLQGFHRILSGGHVSPDRACVMHALGTYMEAAMA